MKRLGDYELLRKIGAGGMAEVWMGRRAAMAGASKAVAVKLLARNVLDDPNYRQMFLEEARLSMLLTNSNVVQVFDVGEIDGECFMVMEWVDGLNLSELARKMTKDKQRMPTVVAAHVVGEVLRGLAYAHGLHHDGSKATIVHRDVSPQNVLVSVSGEVKLADFGVARLASEETSGLHVKGKLRYMAPEQLRGRSREPTVDLYAVGAILHELLEGERFRQTRDEGDLYSMVLSGEIPSVSGEVPAEIERLRVGLLEPEPERRIQTADEALELLYSWPGYRNSSVELARIVRRWIGVEAPRSGILSSEIIAAARAAGQAAEEAAAAASTPAAAAAPASGPVSTSADTREALTRPVSDAVATAVDSGPHAVPEARPHLPSDDVSAITAVESGPLFDRAGTTRTFIEVTPETEATAMIGPERARSSVGSMLIVAAVTLALSFGVFGLGFPLGWWGGGQQQPVVVADAGEPAKQVEDAANAGAKAAPVEAPVETKQEKPPIPADDEVVTSTGEEIGEGDGDGDSQIAIVKQPVEPPTETVEPPTETPKETVQKPKPRKKASAKPVRVKFYVANGLGYATVKIAGKELKVDGNVETLLKPGLKQRIEVQRGMDGPWELDRVDILDVDTKVTLSPTKVSSAEL